MRYSLTFSIAIFVLPLVRALTSPANLTSQDIPKVNSSSGLILGHRSSNRNDTFEFLGIRYAQAPVGSLRFASPRQYVARKETVYEASHWNADCLANIPPSSTFPNFTGNGFTIYDKFTGHLGNPQDEDCLALNIWTKLPSNAGRHNNPVLVFFHGGRFTIPGPHSPFYNGQYLASAENVVVVTINYRLGIFGFSGAPGIEQNSGLRDQRMAVEWVRDNIAGFGGDANRITIFGQSAGSSSVDYWAYAYQKDPIVAGLISESGTALSFIPNNASYARSIFYNVSGALGCGDNTTKDAADVLECVRGKPPRDVLAAAAKAPPLPSQALPQPSFHPVVDEHIVFSDYTALGEAGKYAKIPYLAGNTDYEAGFYRVGAYAANRPLTPAQWELFNQRAFTCPTKYATDFRVKYNVPTWRYRYMGDFDNLRLYGPWSDYPDSGAYHGSDLNMVFGTAHDVSGSPSTNEEDSTSRYIQRAWAAFSRDTKNGLEAYGWPRYDSESRSLVRLAFQNKPSPDFVHPNLYDSPCPPVENNDPLPGQGAF